MNYKYELTKNKKIVNGVTVYQIKRNSDGELGGYVQSTYNLNQHNSCWIYRDVVVLGAARVSGDVLIDGKSLISGTSIVKGSGVLKNVKILGNSSVQRSKIEDAEIIDSTISYSEIKNPYTTTLVIENSKIGANVAKYKTRFSCAGQIKNSIVECFSYSGMINIANTKIFQRDFCDNKIDPDCANAVNIKDLFSNGTAKTSVISFNFNVVDNEEVYVCYRPINDARKWEATDTNKLKMRIWTKSESNKNQNNRFRALKYNKLRECTKSENKFVRMLAEDICNINSKKITKIQDQIIAEKGCGSPKVKTFIKIAIKAEILRISDILIAISEESRINNAEINNLIKGYNINIAEGKLVENPFKNPFANILYNSKYIDKAIEMGFSCES